MVASPPLLAPLDRVRRAWLRALGPAAHLLVRRRDLRVRVGGVLGALLALACAFTAPVVLLAVSPLVLGVPHLLSDVRYLVVRPGLHRQRRVLLGLGLPLLVAAGGEPVLGAAIACVAAPIAAQGPLGRRAGLAALLAVLGGVAIGLGWVAALLLAHAHNGVALWLWWRMRPRQAWDLVVPAAFLAGLAAIALGAADGALLRHDLPAWSAATQLGRLAPQVPAPFDERLVVSFAFAQSVHYGVWLRLVPDDARARPTPRSFAASWHALVADLGRPLVVAAIALVVALGGWALVDLAAANEAYLRLALFHGPMELALLSFAAADRA